MSSADNGLKNKNSHFRCHILILRGKFIQMSTNKPSSIISLLVLEIACLILEGGTLKITIASLGLYPCQKYEDLVNQNVYVWNCLSQITSSGYWT